MATDVRYLVETGGPYALIRLVGVLDPAAAESVRGALLTCLAEQSGAVIIDASRLQVSETAALSVFTAVTSEIADWPTGQFLLCAPYAHPGDGWDAAEIAVAASVEDAFAQLDRPGPVTRPLGVELTPAIGAARQARDLVTDGCARWGVPELTGSASIAVTEMVNNVVAHAETPMSVRLALRDDALHLAVRDYSRVEPAFSGPVAPTAPGGRGLLLIDNVARRWGTSVLDDGKVVWAVLYAEDEPVG